VLDEGAIIGMGTHDQLLDTCDVYREISQSQMGGAFVE
jgi:ATP-binding cassette subfamily B protein